LKDKLLCRIWFNDILDKWKFTGETQFNAMEGTYLSEGDWHFAKIVLSWNFGKMKSKTTKQQISNEELNRINRL
ncbi:MAG: hypothetical protein AAGK97_13670, partial [Bacteroidota bacterium]